MKIKYENTRLKSNLVYGMFMIVIGLFAIFIDGHSVFNYAWIVAGLVQTGTYFFDKKINT